MTIPDLAEVDRHLRDVKKGLRNAGVPDGVIRSIETRALRSGRRMTGPFPSNRKSRWKLEPEDPQYGTEIDCKVILLKLLGHLLEFDGAPAVDATTREILSIYLGRQPQAGTYRDSLTLEHLNYELLTEESTNPTHGRSSFHLGHEDPTQLPKHRPDNIAWRTSLSNLIQGEHTLRDARARFVEIVARYFGLGEVTIEEGFDAGTIDVDGAAGMDAVEPDGVETDPTDTDDET